MNINVKIATAVLAVFVSATLPVQAAIRSFPGNQRQGQGGRGQCQQQAGVTQAAMQQARSLRERAKAEIEAICANNSLTHQQKMEQIRQIHQQTQQQVRGIISQAQQERLQSCRGGNHPVGGP